MRFTLPVVCMHSCSFEALRFGGAIHPPPPRGNRHFVTVPPKGGEPSRHWGGDYKGGVGYVFWIMKFVLWVSLPP